MANRLEHEKSPYLLQHKENPVDWYPWSEEALRKAETEDKPIFLSVGYSTCHWCHVMAHESFEDEEIADLLNRDFIPVKVDREERPDIDAVYMAACQAFSGSGGWPLTVLLTPEKKPFFAGTYFSKTRRYGQPGLQEILKRTAVLWQTDRQTLQNAGEEITALIQSSPSQSPKEPDKKLLQKAHAVFQKQFDPKWGGFGGAPKFPSPHNLLFLLRYASEENEPKALNMTETTLNAMADGGIQDHIGGGFSRYSTDEKWMIPHFEKMLYDNALLLALYSQAFLSTKDERYALTARRTADYVLRELTDRNGGFICGQDADSDGEEGKFYVFTPEECREILGEEDGNEFCRLYSITERGNFEGKSVPNRIGQAEDGWRSSDRRLQKLYEYRKNRLSLHKDDKVLLSWNAWTVWALSRAGRSFKEPRYLSAAIRAQNFIEAKMTDRDGRLFLCWRKGETANSGQLEDYAVYALALLELYRATFDPEYLKNAIFRAEQMQKFFEDRENGGFFLTASDAEKLIVRPKEVYDGALPSGNSAAAEVLKKLALLTGKTEWQSAADRQLLFLAGEIEEYPHGSAFSLLAMADALYPHKELVCSAKHGLSEEEKDMLNRFPENRWEILLKTEENAESLADCAPFTEGYPIPEDGKSYFYLCENGRCKQPGTDLKQILNPGQTATLR